MLVLVPPDLIGGLWPHVAPLLQIVFDKAPADATMESLRSDLLRGDQRLWIVIRDARIIAAATTEIRTAPSGNVCQITTCVGDNMANWRKFLPEMERYAKTQGCRVMRVEGRRGWRRVLPDYHEPWITLEKEL